MSLLLLDPWSDDDSCCRDELPELTAEPMDEAAPATALDKPFTTLRNGIAVRNGRVCSFSSCTPLLPLTGKAEDVLSVSGTELPASKAIVVVVLVSKAQQSW